MASLAGIVADVLIRSETSWAADLVRDLTRLSIGLGVATLTMWHRQCGNSQPVDPDFSTRLGEFAFRTAWDARGKLEERVGAEIIRMPAADCARTGWLAAVSRKTD